MSDFNGESFFSDGSEASYPTQELHESVGQQEAQQTQQQQPQPQFNQQDYVSRQEYEQLQEYNQRQQQAMLDFANRISGRPQQVDPNAALAELVKDPNAFTAKSVEQIIEQRFQQEREERMWDSAIDKARSEYPHLAAFETAIHSPQNVQAAMSEFAKSNGRYPSPGHETVKAAIDHFQKTALQGWQFQSPQMQQQINQLKSQGIPLTTLGSPQLQNSGKPDFRNMTDAQFAEYQKANGLNNF